MAAHDISAQTSEKVMDWTSLIPVNMPVSGVELYHRVEKIVPALLENGTLRVQTQLKLFAVVATQKEQKHLFNPSKIYSNNMDINMFFNLNTDMRREDILSVDHQVLIKNYVPRPDKIIVSGTLTIIVGYILHPILEGSVTRFFNGEPVGGITINVRKIDSEEIISTTSTGNNGKYFFGDLPPGVYLVEALTDSIKPVQKISVIHTRDTVNFVLNK